MLAKKPILVDEQVYAKLKERSRPFETHNDVMRRVFKLPALKRGRPKGTKNKK